MFSAKYFIFDGQMSANYGLQIVDFDDNVVKEFDAFSPTLSLQKVPGLLRFFHGGVEYDSAPTCEFSVLSETEIPAVLRSEILSWLVGRNSFKEIQFVEGDADEYVYRCVFTSVKTIRVNERCHGFRLTAQFDTPYARGIPTRVTVEAGTHNVTINNQSDIIDAYTYPIITFSGGSVDVVNTTDDPQRHFTFSGLSDAEIVTVDNEVRYISSSAGGEKLSNFTSKNWLRLRKGVNVLTIVASGTVTITCPHYAMIGF